MAGEIVDVSLNLNEGLTFYAEFSTGHELLFDASQEEGGANEGPRPTHVLLSSLAACTGMDVISILRKMREPVQGYRIDIQGERAEEHPRVFVRIRITHTLIGDINEKNLARAVELSDSKYCSIGAMLRRSAEIETDFKVERP